MENKEKTELSIMDMKKDKIQRMKGVKIKGNEKENCVEPAQWK